MARGRLVGGAFLIYPLKMLRQGSPMEAIFEKSVATISNLDHEERSYNLDNGNTLVVQVYFFCFDATSLGISLGVVPEVIML